jgi:hypothetical protein
MVGGALTVVLVISVVEKVDKIRQEKIEKRQRSHGEPFITPRQAVLYTVGNQKETILYSIKAQGPAFVGFLCTQRSLPIVQDILSDPVCKLKDQEIKVCDPHNIVDVRDKVGLLFDWFIGQGLSRDDFVLDPTGGMTTMSVGAFSVAEERQYDSQYIRSDYDENNRPKQGTQEAVYISRFFTSPIASGAAQENELHLDPRN